MNETTGEMRGISDTLNAIDIVNDLGTLYYSPVDGTLLLSKKFKSHFSIQNEAPCLLALFVDELRIESRSEFIDWLKVCKGQSENQTFQFKGESVSLTAHVLSSEGYGMLLSVQPAAKKKKQLSNAEILDHIEHSIIYVDRVGTILHWNKGAERIFGLPASEMIGAHIDKLGPGFSIETFEERHKRGELFVSGEWAFPSEGKQRWVKVTTRIITDENDEISGIVGVSSDITDYKELLTQNARQKEHISAVYDSMEVGVVTFNAEGKVLSVNDRFNEVLTFFNKSQVEMNNSIIDISFFAEGFWETTLNSIYAGEAFEHELAWDIEGSEKWFLLKSICIKHKEDGDREFALVIADRTYLKTQEFSLLESEVRFKELFEHSGLAKVFCDLQGHVLEANRACENVFGYTLDEFIGIDFNNLVHEDDRQMAKEILIRLVTGQFADDRVAVRKRYVTKAGAILHIQIYASLVRDHRGDPSYVVAVMHDETSQVQYRQRIENLNEALNYSNIRMNTILDLNKDALILTDRNSVVTKITQAFVDIMEIEEEQFVGINMVQDSVGRSGDGKVLWDDIMKTREVPISYQHEYQTKSGVVKWLQWTIINYLDNPSVGAIAFTIRDVTSERALWMDRNRFLNKLELEKKAAEELHRLKGAFLANMSHEIRTPLNGIIGLSDLIQKEANDPVIKEYASIQEKSAHRLLSTVNSVLEMAKLEARAGTVNKEKIDCVKMLEDILHSFGHQIKGKGLELIKRMPEKSGSEGIISTIDKGVFNMIANNLLSNAIKFTSEGLIEVELSESDDQVFLKVADTGAGMTDSFLQKLFSPFEQESIGYGRKYEGTGLGLAITKQYIDLSGGQILVESEKGVGSTFNVTLPK